MCERPAAGRRASSRIERRHVRRLPDETGSR
nr:MAG TPA: hypothetical protein [Microviridae sp.]